MNNTIRNILSVILLGAICFFSLQIISESKKRQTIVIENAEIKNIKYGLLSVHSWKKQVSEILAKKVREFDLTTENRRELKSSIQNALYKLLDEVSEIMEERRNEGGAFRRFFTGLFQTLVFDISDLRRKVPEFTEIILAELDNYETREKLRKFVQRKIDEFLYKTVGEEDLSKVVLIENKYDCNGILGCSNSLEAKLNYTDKKLSEKSIMIIGLAILIFLIILLGNRDISNFGLYILIATCGVLLYAGVSTPMIDIDARIDNFEFLLMGEPLAFKNQILFFQSKSIFEVVNILVSTGDHQSMIVGGLIFLFSIIFPISKLLSSMALVQKKELYNNKLINFLALKSGKWSMADVVVVAIFMAYIGFRGVIENQLSQLEKINSKIEILTTDNSNFGVGFMLFLAFCLGGLLLASYLEKNIKNQSMPLRAI